MKNSRWIGWLLVAVITVMMTACGGGGSNDPAMNADVAKIVNWAKNGGTPPTADDYDAAGVILGTHTADEINRYIKQYYDKYGTSGAFDSKAELDKIADELGVTIVDADGNGIYDVFEGDGNDDINQEITDLKDSGGGAFFSNITFIDEKHGWMSNFTPRLDGSNTNFLLKTEDGKKWDVINDKMPYCDFDSLKFVSRTKGYCLHSTWGELHEGIDLLATTDGGVTWSKIAESVHEEFDAWNRPVKGSYILGTSSNADYTVILVRDFDPAGSVVVLKYISNETNAVVKEVVTLLGTYDEMGGVYIKENNDVILSLKILPRDNNEADSVISLYEYGFDTWHHQKWSDLDDGFAVISMFTMNRAIDFVNNSVGYIATQTLDGGVMNLIKTTDGGKSWSNVFKTGEKGVYFTSIDFADENHGLACLPIMLNPHAYYTDDGGRTWSPIYEKDSGGLDPAYSVVMASENVGYIGGVDKVTSIKIK